MQSRAADGRFGHGAPDSEVRAKLLSALRAGNFRRVAAKYAGIHENTFKYWMRLGQERPDGPYGEFRRDVIEAENAAHVAMVAVVVSAAKQDAKHAEWFLERKFPNEWGRKDRHRVDINPAQKLSDEELDAHIREKLGRRAERDAGRGEESGGGDGGAGGGTPDGGDGEGSQLPGGEGRGDSGDGEELA